MPAHMGVPASHERASARYTDRVLAISMAEGDCISLHPLIEGRRHCGWIAHMPKHVAAPLVRIKKHDMWLLCHHVFPGSTAITCMACGVPPSSSNSTSVLVSANHSVGK